MGTDTGGAVPTNATQDKTGQRASHLFIRGSQWVHGFYNANGWSERNRQIIYLQCFFCWYLLFLAALYKIVWKHGLDEPPRGSKTSLRRSGCYWVGKDPRLIIRSSIFKQTQSFTNKLQISCSVGILSTCLPGGKYRDFQKIMFPTFWIFIWPWKSITPLSRASINQEMMSLHFASLPVKEKVNAVQPLTQTLFIPCFLFFVFSVWYF